MLNKEKIKELFSKYAKSYNGVSDFQREIGHRLIGKVLSEKMVGENILDVGSGTGNISQEFARRLGKKIYGCDIAWGMTSFSKMNTTLLFICQADAENLPYKKETFDIIFSNITYQWVYDFKKAFLEVKRILKRGSRFYFSILVKDSLKELYRMLEIIFSSKGRKDYCIDFLLASDDLKIKFKETDLRIMWWEEKVIKRYYGSSLELLKTLKFVGAGKILESNLFRMGDRKLFFDMLKEYDKNFSEGEKVFASYKVVLGCVEKI